MRRLMTLIVSVLVVGALAAPASAGVESGTLVIPNGTATVGVTIGGGAIPEQGNCIPTGKGLNTPVPGIHGPAGSKNKSKVTNEVVNKEVYYRLDVDVDAVLADTNAATASGPYVGHLDVCGIVSPGTAGIGAACGSSIGHSGKGKLDVTQVGLGARRVFLLQDVAWVAAVGGVLPAYGHITRIGTLASPTDKTMKQSAKGTFEAVVNAFPLPGGVRSCQNPKPNNGNTFQVNGVASAQALGKPQPKARESKLQK